MTRIQDTRFRHMVRPGDVLDIEVTLTDALEPLFHLSGKASVGGTLAVSTKFSCALAPKPGES
jgi:3-hydroxyacyl-[acyl-carrier-protein] dehydratase